MLDFDVHTQCGHQHCIDYWRRQRREDRKTAVAAWIAVKLLTVVIILEVVPSQNTLFTWLVCAGAAVFLIKLRLDIRMICGDLFDVDRFKLACAEEEIFGDMTEPH